MRRTAPLVWSREMQVALQKKACPLALLQFLRIIAFLRRCWGRLPRRPIHGSGSPYTVRRGQKRELDGLSVRCIPHRPLWCRRAPWPYAALLASPRAREKETSHALSLGPDGITRLIAFERASRGSGATSFPQQCTLSFQTACVPPHAPQCHSCRAGDSAF